MGVVEDLELLVRSRYPIIAVETHEERRVEQSLDELATKLTLPLFVWTTTDGLKRYGTASSIYDTQRPEMALGNLASMKEEGLYLFKDLHRYLESAEIVRRLRDLAEPFSQDRRALILSAPEIVLPAELAKIAARVRVELPTAHELEGVAKTVLSNLSRQHEIAVRLSPSDFERLIHGMKGLTLFEAERVLTKAALDDLAVTVKDLETVIELKKDLLEQGGILTYHPPEEGMAQVGGLETLKRWIGKRRRAFSKEARRFGVPVPRGVLLLGVQGCGKSLAAKAVALEWGVPLLRLEPGRLYDKFIGQSERNLDGALETAERMAPCVLMVDEIEKGFASVGSAEADGGLSQRIFGRLLGWLQERAAAVFVVATCNQVANLPPELMRKGRFDEIFFIDLPTRRERAEIFALQLRKRNRDPAAFDLEPLADAADGFSGAEIEQAIVSGLYTAFSEDQDISTDLLLAELQATKPLSVTRREEIQALRAWAAGRAVSAGQAGRER